MFACSFPHTLFQSCLFLAMNPVHIARPITLERDSVRSAAIQHSNEQADVLHLGRVLDQKFCIVSPYSLFFP